MKEFTGTVQKLDIGRGVWVLNANDGTTYELMGATAELKQEGARVAIQGTIQEGMVSAAMVGPILKVNG
jgi:hypothetical protein